MREIEANKKAWGTLARDQYERFRKLLADDEILLNRIIREELGEIRGKDLIHLQCNTGADTISLARLGAKVTGVDLAPENIVLAQQLAAECEVTDATFIESDIMTLETESTYDIVFTSEGAIGWLPDLGRWAQVIRSLLKDGGFVYVFDSHPFYLTLDEDAIVQGQLQVKYPYFSKVPDRSEVIGGYTATPRQAENYFWSYTVEELFSSLRAAGLTIEFFHEHDVLYYDEGGMEQVDKGLFRYPKFEGNLPLSFSLKAVPSR